MAKKITPTKIIYWLLTSGLSIWVLSLPLQTRLLLVSRSVNTVFWEYGSISLYATELLLGLVVCVWLVYAVVTQDIVRVIQYTWQSLRSPSVTVSKLLVVLFISMGLGSLWSVDVLVTVSRLVHVVLAGIGIGLLVYVRLPWQRVALLIVAGSVVQSMFAIDQAFDQVVVSSKYLGIGAQYGFQYGTSVILHNQGRWLRAYGLMPHPNILGGMLAFAVMLCSILYGAVQKKLPENRYYAVLSVALLTALVFVYSGLLLSFSRAGWLAAGIALVWIAAWVWLFKPQLRSRLARIVLVLLLTTGLWFSVHPTPFVVRLTGQEPLERQSLEERELSYTDASPILTSVWWRGLGLGTYTHKLLQDHPERPMHLQQPIHNTWLLVLSELGIVGLVAFFLLFVLVWKHSHEKILSMALLSSLGIAMLFDHWWVSLVIGPYILGLWMYVAWYARID